MLRSTDRADRRDPLSQSTRLQAVDWDCGGSQSDARYCCGRRRCLFRICFAGLSECRFSVPTPESHRSVVSLSSSQTLYRSFPCKHENSLAPLFLLSPKSLSTFRGTRRSWQNHIPSSRSSSCSRLSGNKKAGTQMRTDSPQKDRLIPCDGGFTFM